MADYLVTDTELTSIANAIRAKSEINSSLSFPNGFVSAINNIQTLDDIPEFVLLWDASWTSTTNTCNKTYAQCIALINNNNAYPIKVKQVSQEGDSQLTMAILYYDGTLYAYCLRWDGIPFLKIIYNSNGTVDTIWNPTSN